MGSWDDGVKITYEGPPRWDGTTWVTGDKFVLSGPRNERLAHGPGTGVELSKELSGLPRPEVEDRYDSAADLPGSRYVGSIPKRRTIKGAINFVADTPQLLRALMAKWDRNHPEKSPYGKQFTMGKLSFEATGSTPRFLLCRKTPEAGLGALEQDPAIHRRLLGLEWGWVSDSPYFMGADITVPISGPTTFTTVGTVSTYPVVYVTGPSAGGPLVFTDGINTSTVTLPQISAGEELRIDYHPADMSLLKRTIATGDVKSVWSKLYGQRPKFSLEPGVKHTVTYTGEAKLIYTPLFLSWTGD